MAGITIQLTGADELKRLLDGLPTKLEKKYLRKGVRDVGNKILASAKSRVPVDTSAAKDSLKVRAFKRTRKGIVGVTIGYRRVERRPSRKAGEKKGAYRQRVRASKGAGEQVFYGMHLEYGTAHTPAEPVLRPAFDSNRTSAISILTGSVRQCVTEAKV